MFSSVDLIKNYVKFRGVTRGGYKLPQERWQAKFYSTVIQKQTVSRNGK
jgi:hypothetical protein